MRITDGDVFRILEIEPTCEEKEIKKAYAKLVKKYHPEEYPEKWREIHEVYEKALALALAEREGHGNLSIFKKDKEKTWNFVVQDKTAQAEPPLKLSEENSPEPVMKSGETEIPPRSSQENSPGPVMKSGRTEIPSRSSQENPPEPVMKSGETEIPPRSSQENSPEPVMKSGETEIPPRPSPESDEIDALFDSIEELSREQHHQDEETFKRKLQEVMNDFRKVSGKNEIDIKEWEAFFNQETRLPYICTREFLEMLGDCFENRKIEVEMYRFLKEQLAVIAQYGQDRNIELQNVGLLNPVDYAEKKIYKAYAGESAAGSVEDAGTRRRKVRRTMWIVMLVVGAIMRFIAGYTRSARRVPEVPPITMIENTAADSTVENTTADSTNDIADKMMSDMVTEVDGNTIRVHMSSYFNMMQIGDTRETMIEAMGEPEEIQESQEDPDYEAAVYLLSEHGGRLVIVLENGVITEIYAESTIEGINMEMQYETSQDESKGE